MQTTNFGLSDTLRRVKEKSLTIPQFQRPFTWRESQVKLLIDSLARAYPIGSILLLAKTPELQLMSRSIEAVIREGYPPDDLLNANPTASSEVFYVLDGQQRLTSVARVLLNAHPTKTYYFDLKAVMEDYPKEETSWIVTRARGKNDPDRKDKGWLLRSDIVLDKAIGSPMKRLSSKNACPQLDRQGQIGQVCLPYYLTGKYPKQDIQCKPVPGRHEP